MLQSRKVAPFSIAFFLLCCASSLWPLCERLQGTLHWKKIYWSFFFACEQRAVAYLGSFPDKTASSSCDNPGPVQIQPLTKQSLSEGVCVLSLRHSAIQGVWWTPVSRGEQQQREQAGTSSPAKDKCLLVLPPLLALGSVLLSQQDCVHSTHVNCSRTEILHILGSWSIISWVSTHFFHAENGPVHFWSISKIRSWIQHKSFLVYLVRYTKYMCVNIYIYIWPIYFNMSDILGLPCSQFQQLPRQTYIWDRILQCPSLCPFLCLFSNTLNQFFVVLISTSGILFQLFKTTSPQNFFPYLLAPQNF